MNTQRDEIKAAEADGYKAAVVSAEYTKDMTRYPEGSSNREISMRQSMAADLVQRRIRALILPSSSVSTELIP